MTLFYAFPSESERFFLHLLDVITACVFPSTHIEEENRISSGSCCRRQSFSFLFDSSKSTTKEIQGYVLEMERTFSPYSFIHSLIDWFIQASIHPTPGTRQRKKDSQKPYVHLGSNQKIVSSLYEHVFFFVTIDDRKSSINIDFLAFSRSTMFFFHWRRTFCRDFTGWSSSQRMIVEIDSSESIRKLIDVLCFVFPMPRKTDNRWHCWNSELFIYFFR